MRKLKIIFSFVLLMFIGIISVKADNWTLEQFVIELEKSEEFSYFKQFEESGVITLDTKIINDGRTLQIDYRTNKGDIVISDYAFNDGIISYDYTGNKTNLTEDDRNKLMMDAIWTSAIISTVSNIHGYNEEDLYVEENDELKFKERILKSTLEKNGLEISFWNVELNEDGESLNGEAIDSFKININNFYIELGPTLEEVVQKLKEGETFKLYPETNLEFTDTTLKITNLEDDEEYITSFTYSDGILTYNYPSSKDTLTDHDIKRNFYSLRWFEEIVEAVALLNGYELSDLEKVITKEEDFTLKDNGLEITSWTYSEESDTGHFRYTTYDTFKINIKKLNLGELKKDQEDEEPIKPQDEQNPPEQEKVPENPNTGASISIGILFLGLVAIYFLKQAHKNEKIHRL